MFCNIRRVFATEITKHGAVTTTEKMEKEKKLYIETYGCQMNVADSEVVAAVMEMSGYGIPTQSRTPMRCC